MQGPGSNKNGFDVAAERSRIPNVKVFQEQEKKFKAISVKGFVHNVLTGPELRNLSQYDFVFNIKPRQQTKSCQAD